MGFRRGSILILVLFVMAVLALAAVSFAYRAALESRSVRHRVVMARLRAHALSAVSIAVARLMENTNDFDHRAEHWHTHKPLASEGWLTEWTEDQAGRPPVFVTDYYVIDEEGKLNVLYASGEALRKLGMSAEQIACLSDWMDSDDIAQSEGAESQYYLTRPKSYRCKDAPIELLEELLLIKGFGPADYLGEDANHNRRLDAREDDGGLSYPPDDADGRVRLGWVDLLSCRADGLINLNTAPRLVLETLPLSDGAVDQILAYRSFDEDSSGDLGDHVFRSESDIEQLQGLTGPDGDVLKGIARFRSELFRIIVRSSHLPTGLTYRLQVLVRAPGARPKILQWKVGL